MKYVLHVEGITEIRKKALRADIENFVWTTADAIQQLVDELKARGYKVDTKRVEPILKGEVPPIKVTWEDNGESVVVTLDFQLFEDAFNDLKVALKTVRQGILGRITGRGAEIILDQVRGRLKDAMKEYAKGIEEDYANRVRLEVVE